jgi:hypothetical protein
MDRMDKNLWRTLWTKSYCEMHKDVAENVLAKNKERGVLWYNTEKKNGKEVSSEEHGVFAFKLICIKNYCIHSVFIAK